MATTQKISTVCTKLEQLYGSYGYKKYAMRKFEEYSLYVENKNFLTSEYILTFNDPGGKLMALRPDVTLSILKNAKNSDEPQKTYYRENVYRLDKQSKQYREIEQIGLEILGSSGALAEGEICALACKSLESIDSDYILCISNMEYVLAFLDGIKDLHETERDRLLSFIKAKNAHELLEALVDAGCEASRAESFAKLIMLSEGADETIRQAYALCENDRMKNALVSLERLCVSDKIRVDLTLINDSAYYNGLVFCGYVRKIPKAVLVGGFYDKMAEKFGNTKGGAGFALSVGDLSVYEERSEYDFDILMLYSDSTDFKKALDFADSYREKGFSVRLEREIPKSLKYKEMINI